MFDDKQEEIARLLSIGSDATKPDHIEHNKKFDILILMINFFGLRVEDKFKENELVNQGDSDMYLFVSCLRGYSRYRPDEIGEKIDPAVIKIIDRMMAATILKMNKKDLMNKTN